MIDIIKHNPDWASRRRVCAALAERGIALSERTVGDILPVARERLARAREAQQRAAQARERRLVAKLLRWVRRYEERRDSVRRKFNEILKPGITPQEACVRIADALAAKGWKIEAKDLTPELEDFADAYLRMVRANPDDYLGEKWLLEADRSPNQDNARVAAINHFVKRIKGAHWWRKAPPRPGRIATSAKNKLVAHDNIPKRTDGTGHA